MNPPKEQSKQQSIAIINATNLIITLYITQYLHIKITKFFIIMIRKSASFISNI